MAMTATCLACQADKTPAEYCNKNPTTVGCKEPIPKCCRDETLSCKAGCEKLTKFDFCHKMPESKGCEQLIPEEELEKLL